MARPPVPIVVAALFATVAGYALAGCAPDGGESPSPEPTVEAATPSPSPQWTAEQQGAIDAVQKYLEVWTDIGQNLETADWNTIREVSSDPESNHDLLMWGNWFNQGWHLVGAPVFTPQSVIPGSIDYQGENYDVYGCYVITDSYISDANGNSVGDNGRQERGVSRYRVLHTAEDQYFVIDGSAEDEIC